jgi:hypothetical protein
MKSLLRVTLSFLLLLVQIPSVVEARDLAITSGEAVLVEEDSAGDSTGLADEVVESQNSFESLLVGTRVTLILEDGEKIKGSFHRIGEDYIELRLESKAPSGEAEGEILRVKNDDIREVKKPGRNWFKIAWIAGAGVAGGIILFAVIIGALLD